MYQYKFYFISNHLTDHVSSKHHSPINNENVEQPYKFGHDLINPWINIIINADFLNLKISVEQLVFTFLITILTIVQVHCYSKKKQNNISKHK